MIDGNLAMANIWEGGEPSWITHDTLFALGFKMDWATDPQEPNALRKYTLGNFVLLKFESDSHYFYSFGKGNHEDLDTLPQLYRFYENITGKKLFKQGTLNSKR